MLEYTAVSTMYHTRTDWQQKDMCQQTYVIERNMSSTRFFIHGDSQPPKCCLQLGLGNELIDLISMCCWNNPHSRDVNCLRLIQISCRGDKSIKPGARSNNRAGNWISGVALWLKFGLTWTIKASQSVSWSSEGSLHVGRWFDVLWCCVRCFVSCFPSVVAIPMIVHSASDLLAEYIIVIVFQESDTLRLCGATFQSSLVRYIGLASGWWFGTYFPIFWECHHPNWLSYFSEGWPWPTNQAWFSHFCHMLSLAFNQHDFVGWPA